MTSQSHSMSQWLGIMVPGEALVKNLCGRIQPPPPPGTLHLPQEPIQPLILNTASPLPPIPTHGALICPSLLHTHTHTHARARPISESGSGESHCSQMLTAFPEQQMNESLLLTNGCRKGGRMKVISPLNADFRLIFHT